MELFIQSWLLIISLVASIVVFLAATKHWDD